MFSQSFSKEENQKLRKIFNYLTDKYSKNPDPWGFDIKQAKKTFKVVWPIYKDYFKVRVFGAENVKNEPYMMISNHTGQVAFDAVLIGMSLVWDVWPPRVARGMVERFLPKLPFVGDFVSKTGGVLGDRQNCQYLINQGESVLAFPEGVKGISKSSKDYYKLQNFTRGFMRLALTNKIPILPIAVIGAEEAYPWIYQAKGLAKILKLPALPLSPLMPLLGPLSLVPLPTPVDIYFGEPIQVNKNLSPDAPDSLLEEEVLIIKTKINEMIEKGLENRRPFWANKK